MTGAGSDMTAVIGAAATSRKGCRDYRCPRTESTQWQSLVAAGDSAAGQTVSEIVLKLDVRGLNRSSMSDRIEHHQVGPIADPYGAD